jgi:hypothetical protein
MDTEFKAPDELRTGAALVSRTLIEGPALDTESASAIGIWDEQHR